MPILESLGLSKEQVEARRTIFGGSDANKLMKGGSNVIDLWNFKTGRAENDDFSDDLFVMLGHYIEPFHREWFTKKTGVPVSMDDLSISHPDHSVCPRTASLDGRAVVTDRAAIWEGKFVTGYVKLVEVIETYQPQLHHNMHCAGTDLAVLSVMLGTAKHEWVVVEKDQFYLNQLLDREDKFWDCVVRNVKPDFAEISAPTDNARMGHVPSAKERPTRILDMRTNNEWVSTVHDYLGTKDASARHDEAKEKLKSMVPADVAKVYGAGIEINRDSRGALRFSKGAEE